MTVKELIARLEEFPDDAHVTIMDSNPMVSFVAYEMDEVNLDVWQFFDGRYFPRNPRHPQTLRKVVILQ